MDDKISKSEFDIFKDALMKAVEKAEKASSSGSLSLIFEHLKRISDRLDKIESNYEYDEDEDEDEDDNDEEEKDNDAFGLLHEDVTAVRLMSLKMLKILNQDRVIIGAATMISLLMAFFIDAGFPKEEILKKLGIFYDDSLKLRK